MKTRFLLTTALVILCSTFVVNAQVEPDIVYPTGGGSASLQVYPFDGTFGYTYNTSIYNKANIGVSGSIEEISYYVAVPSNDSVTVTIKLEELSNAEFGGYDTYGMVSTNGFQVFQHKVAFNTIGFHTFNLDVPFSYDSSYHLGVYVSCGWGGTGPTTVPEFACETVNSTTDFVNMAWGQDNSFPISQLSVLTNYRPYIGLKFDAPTAPIMTSSVVECAEVEFLAIAFGGSDQVIIAYNHTGNFSSPACGNQYSPGDTLYDGSEVVYSGAPGTIIHSGVQPGSVNSYKIWSYDEYNIYSSTGYESEIVTNYNIPYSTNFDGGSTLPVGFSGGWENLADHGSTSNGLVAELTPSVTVRHLMSPFYCELTTNSKFTFQYRIVNIAGYPSTATPAAEIDSILVKMMDPTSGTYSTIYSITSSNHVASTSFSTMNIPVGAFEGGLTEIIISAYSGTGSYFVDIDNFAITDPSAIDENNGLSLLVYPNPASDVISIDNSNRQFTSFRIFDLTGKLLMVEDGNNEALQQIDISHLNSGMYIIEAFSAISYARTKLIKK